jgi:hypothetical protein
MESEDALSELPQLVLERIALATLRGERLKSVAALSSVNQRMRKILAPQPRNPFWPQAYRALRGSPPPGLRSKALFSRLRKDAELNAQRAHRMDSARQRLSLCVLLNASSGRATVYETIKIPVKSAARLIPLRLLKGETFHEQWLCARFFNEPSNSATQWLNARQHESVAEFHPIRAQLGDLLDALETGPGRDVDEDCECMCCHGDWFDLCALSVPRSKRLTAMLMPCTADQVPEFSVIRERDLQRLLIELHFLAYRRHLCRCKPVVCAYVRQLFWHCMRQGVSNAEELRSLALQELTWMPVHTGSGDTSLSFSVWLAAHDIQRRYAFTGQRLFSDQDIERIEHCA